MASLPRWQRRPAHLGHDETVDSTTVSRITTDIARRVKAAPASTWVVCLMCLVHALYISWLQVDMHLGLGTFSYDVGLYDQGLWLLSRGEAPFVTLMGRNLFGDHASFILIFLVPLYWIIPGTATLLVVQAFAIAAAALPIFFFARRVFDDSFIATMFALVWLVNPAVNGTNMENFHPDGFLGLTVALALFAALSSRWRLYAVSLALCLLVKEDVVLLAFPLGVYVFFTLSKRKGIVTMISTVAVTLIGMFLVMRPLIGVPTRNGWRIPFGGFTGLLKETFQRPGNVLEYLTQDDRPLYVFQMFAPLLIPVFVAPALAAVAVPVLASNVISNFWYQHSIQYHYSIVVMPVLVFATILGVKKVSPKYQRMVVAAIATASVATFVAWGQTPLSNNPRPVWSSNYVVATTAREIISVVPDDAVISVYDPLTTFMAHRKEVYFFPNPFKAVYYGVDDSLNGQRIPAADRVEYVVLPKSMSPELQWDWQLVRPEFELIKENQHWEVFRRRG